MKSFKKQHVFLIEQKKKIYEQYDSLTEPQRANVKAMYKVLKSLTKMTVKLKQMKQKVKR